MLLLTFTGFGGLAGMGMGPAATKDVAAHRGRNDAAGALAAARACISVTLVSSITLSLLMIFAGLTLGPDLLARVGEPNEVRAIICFAAVLIALEQLDSVFAGSLRGLERFDLSARIEVTAKFAMVVSTVIIAWATRDLITIYWCVTLLTVIRAMAKAWWASKLLGGALIPSFDRARAQEAFAFGKWTWAQSLGGAMFATADRLLVGALLGADALARYSVCVQLAQQIQTIPAAGAQFLFPAVSRRRETGEDFRQLALRASLIIGGAGVLMAVPIAIFSFNILNLWVGTEIAAATWPVLSLLAVGYAILAINVGPHYALLGDGNARMVAAVNVFAGVFATGVAVFAIPFWQISGAAAARICYAVAICSLFVQFLKIGVTRSASRSILGE